MSILKRIVGIFTVALMLCMNIPILEASAVSFSNQQTVSNEISEIEISEEKQKVNLTKDREYIISYLVKGEGWAVSEVRYYVKRNGWKAVKAGVEDKYVRVKEVSSNKPDRVSLKVTCKSSEVTNIESRLENEITGEVKEFSSAAEVSELPVEYVNDDSEDNSSDDVVDDKSFDDEPTGTPEDKPSENEPGDDPDDKPSEDEPGDDSDDNPSENEPGDDSDDNPSENEPGDDSDDKPSENEPGDKDDGDKPVKPAPIIIDTTGWLFNAVQVVYDGTEYKVEVTGLPEYVTPVYTNNKRTNAGTSTAHVSFLVPEGYATPEDMETTITIDKAPIYVMTKENLVETDDGKLKFSIPEGALPSGVSYKYKVNDLEADSDYAITTTGMYLISADFEMDEEFTEEMKQNYIVDQLSAIYNVLEHEDVSPSQYGLNFELTLQQEESENSDEVKVTVGIKFASPSGRNSVLTYVPVYDSSVLTYTGSVLPDGMGGGKINSSGVVSAYAYDGGLLNDGPLTTFVFSINEGADTSNIPLTITEVSGVWIAPDPSVIDKSTSYSKAIVLNPGVDAEQFTVMLPYPAGSQHMAVLNESTDMQLLNEECNADKETDLVSETDVVPVETEEVESDTETANVSLETEDETVEVDGVSAETSDTTVEPDATPAETEEVENDTKTADVSLETEDETVEVDSVSAEIVDTTVESEETEIETTDVSDSVA